MSTPSWRLTYRLGVWIELARSFFGRQGQSADEISGIDVEPIGDSDNGLQPETSLASLDLAELRPVDTAADSCGFLTKSKRGATIPDPFPKRPNGLVEGWLGEVVWHEGNHIRPARNRPERDVRMLIAPMRNRL